MKNYSLLLILAMLTLSGCAWNTKTATESKVSAPLPESLTNYVLPEKTSYEQWMILTQERNKLLQDALIQK